MLLAALAFVHQGAISVVSQAAAAMGLMPDPAVTLSGPVHYHGNVTRHVHAHHGDQVGHVHDPFDIDSDDGDKRAASPLCSLGAPSGVLPVAALCPLLFESVVRTALRACDSLTGTDPDPLNRPPSTPSIA
jgi:hypothetical protein